MRYISSFSTYTYHQIFDTALLDICSRIYEKVDCYSSPTTLPYLKEKIKNERICYKSIYVVKSVNKRMLLIKYLVSAIQNVIYFLLSSKNEVVIFNNNNPYSLHVINVVNRIKKNKVIICCHGELELLNKSEKEKGYISRLNGFIINDFFCRRKLNEGMYFLVLGNVIYENLKTIIGENSNHFIPLEHPYYFSSDYKVKNQKGGKLIIGSIGSLNANKGENSFLEFAKAIFKKRNDIEIRIVGRTSIKEQFEKIGVNVADEYLPRDIYDQQVRELDYILFFYPTDSYKLTASGALFDAINFNTPIISLKNDFFNDAFMNTKDIGCLLDTIEEMVDAVLHLPIVSPKTYEFDDIKKKYSVENLTIDFKSKLTKLGLA